MAERLARLAGIGRPPQLWQAWPAMEVSYPLSDGSLTHRRVALESVRLHVVEAGEGPLVVLLHGFPEFWYSWRHQIPALAAAGFRVVAPDMRGYGESDKPKGVAAYRATELARDVAQLIEALGERKASVVGHDWGGAVAWSFAMAHNSALDKLVVLNSVHPAQIAESVTHPKQLLKSWYVLAFQLPLLPEAVIRAFDFALLRRVLASDTVRKNAFARADIDRYIEALAQPGALTSTINYYRAMMRSLLLRSKDEPLVSPQRVAQPVLVIWGEQDSYLEPWFAEPPREWAPSLRVERCSEASHWVQVDAPERVNHLLVQFLGGN